MPNKTWGITYENWHETSAVIAALKGTGLEAHALVRTPFYAEDDLDDYVEPLDAYWKARINVLPELCDSFETKDMSLRTFKKRCDKALKLFGPRVSTIEASNEPNGDWAGRNSGAMGNYAIEQCTKAGIRSLVTFHANPGLEKWVKKNPMKPSIVGLSCYPEDVGPIDVPATLRMLRKYYPTQPFIISEFGPGESASTNNIRASMERFYLYNPADIGEWWYFGGYWYGSQHCMLGMPGHKILTDVLKKR